MATVVVTGSRGLVGSALVPVLAARGDRVVRLLRGGASEADAPRWDPATRRLDSAALEGVDAVVHLAGESIAAGRWTDARKAAIRQSRVDSTRLLAEAMAGLARRPSVFVCASATGYYGDRGGEVLREDSAPGTGFLAAVCRDWEAAAAPARQAGVRVVHLRSGVVLASSGGMLPRLLPLFRLGLGGRLGSGRQYMSWIALADLIDAIVYLLGRTDIAGPVNTVARHPITNREFTRALARAVARPAAMAVPAVALRFVFGELAEDMLLASARVKPARLVREGFQFRFPDIEATLAALVARGRPVPPVSPT